MDAIIGDLIGRHSRTEIEWTDGEHHRVEVVSVAKADNVYQLLTRTGQRVIIFANQKVQVHFIRRSDG